MTVGPAFASRSAPGCEMPFEPVVMRSRRGRTACLSGAMAEDAVARSLQGQGVEILARRWRGCAGEIDLICRQGDDIVFVEVKQAATHDQAAARLGAVQQARICRAACEFCEALPGGQLTAMRFDVALVDRLGRIEIMQNAFGDCFA